jgi:hypothetical protein
MVEVKIRNNFSNFGMEKIIPTGLDSSYMESANPKCCCKCVVGGDTALAATAGRDVPGTGCGCYCDLPVRSVLCDNASATPTPD